MMAVGKIQGRHTHQRQRENHAGHNAWEVSQKYAREVKGVGAMEIMMTVIPVMAMMTVVTAIVVTMMIMTTAYSMVAPVMQRWEPHQQSWWFSS